MQNVIESERMFLEDVHNQSLWKKKEKAHVPLLVYAGSFMNEWMRTVKSLPSDE